MTRGLLIAVGSLCVTLGVVGIIVPLLPTTPFLLVAAACYMRSSPRLHRWLLSNRWFGSYLRSYQEGHGIPLVTKAVAVVVLWASMGVSALLVLPDKYAWVRAVLALIALAVTIHILRIRTRTRDHE